MEMISSSSKSLMRKDQSGLVSLEKEPTLVMESTEWSSQTMKSWRPSTKKIKSADMVASSTLMVPYISATSRKVQRMAKAS